jgi:peptide deformylase
MKSTYNHQQTVTAMTAMGPVTTTVQHKYEHSAPMLYADRDDAYYRQNGRRPLTVRQERQLRKTLNRSIVRAVVLLGDAR